WGILAVLLGAIALTTYNPAASAFVVDISPESLRGIYFAINSQCWAIGYLIGPPLGGWVLDQGEVYAHNFWLILASSVAIAIFTLQYLISQE
ncbi:MAG: MFS transporter, partial [Cyanobacteria bacterium J149]